jgi:hypothetical protein
MLKLFGFQSGVDTDEAKLAFDPPSSSVAVEFRSRGLQKRRARGRCARRDEGRDTPRQPSKPSQHLTAGMRAHWCQLSARAHLVATYAGIGVGLERLDHLERFSRGRSIDA